MGEIRIVEIKEQDNGAHRNCTTYLANVPDGWAKVPEGMELENFPFGEISAEEIDGVMTVTEWIPGTIPEEEETETSHEPTAEEILNAIVGGMSYE